jgi:hypothetical protein
MGVPDLPQDAPTSSEETTVVDEFSEQDEGEWLYFIDSAYDPDEDVPLHAVIGGWQVDEDGQFGPFTGNPDYRPNPAVLGMDPPTDAVDEAVQLAVTGHGGDGDVAAALAEADLYLPADEQGELVAYHDDDGMEFVAVFTDASKAPSEVAQLLPVEIGPLLEVVPEHTTVVVNPGSQASASFAREDLMDALSIVTDERGTMNSQGSNRPSLQSDSTDGA